MSLSTFPVAPHAGAWVETHIDDLPSNLDWSRPMRARGLKLVEFEGSLVVFRRAPCGRVG